MAGARVREALRIRKQIVREMLAEFIGTFILVTFGIGAGAQYTLSRGGLGDFLTVNFAGGMGLTFGIYWAGGVSGASLNPAVTLALCLQDVVAWWKWPFYTVAELLGAFMAAAVQYGVFYDGINNFDGGVRQTYGPNATAGIFSTFPRDGISTANCLGDQVFGTWILISCILAVTDQYNMRPDKGLQPIALGAIVFAIGTCWAFNCGYAINPARDLGPRVFTAIAGWGVEPFSYRDYNWFWVPIVGPMIGSVFAWVCYSIFIQLHWPATRGNEMRRVAGREINVNGGVDSRDKDGVVNPAFSSSNEAFVIEIPEAQKTRM